MIQDYCEKSEVSKENAPTIPKVNIDANICTFWLLMTNFIIDRVHIIMLIDCTDYINNNNGANAEMATA